MKKAVEEEVLNLNTPVVLSDRKYVWLLTRHAA